MSLLAELEELQRCLEGTGDSDSEDISKLDGCSANTSQSLKRAVPSLENKKIIDCKSLLKVSVSQYPSVTDVMLSVDRELSCKNLNLEENKSSDNVSCITADKFAMDAEESTIDDRKNDSADYICGEDTPASSRKCSPEKEFSLKYFTSEEEKTFNDKLLETEVLSDSVTAEIAGKSNIVLEVLDGDLLPTSSIETHFTSTDSNKEEVNVPTSREDELRDHSLNEGDAKATILKEDEVTTLVLKRQGMQDEAERSNASPGRGEVLTSSLPVNTIDNLETDSQVSDKKELPISLNSEKTIVSNNSQSDEKKKNNSPLKSWLGSPKRTSPPKQVSINPAKPKLGEVRMSGIKPMIKVKKLDSLSDMAVGNKTKFVFESRLLPIGAPKEFKTSPVTGIRKLGSRQSEHKNGNENVEKVQPLSARVTGDVESKTVRLEEVKITNGRPIIRIKRISAEPKLSVSETTGILEVPGSSNATLLTKEGSDCEGKSAIVTPTINKRKVSFNIHPQIASIDKTIERDSGSEKRVNISDSTKLEEHVKIKNTQTDSGATSATLQQISESKSVPISVLKEHVYSKTCKVWENLKTSDSKLSVKKRKLSLDSGLSFEGSSTLQQPSETKHPPVPILKKEVALQASKPVSQKRIIDTPLPRKRRASSDPTALANANVDVASSDSNTVNTERTPNTLVPSVGKRRKVSVSEVGMQWEDKLSLEPTPQHTVSGKVDCSPSATRQVPVLSESSPQKEGQNLLATFVKDAKEKLNKPINQEMSLKENRRKECMEVRVVVKRLNIPIPEHLLSTPEKMKSTQTVRPLKLQKTLNKISKELQQTLPESAVEKKRIVGKQGRPFSVIAGPIKKKIDLKQVINHHKAMRNSTQHRLTGQSKQQKIAARGTKQTLIQNVTPKQSVKKPIQQKVKRIPLKQKITRKPSKQPAVKQPKAVSKSNAIQKVVPSSPTNTSSFAVRIGPKKKKIILPNKRLSSRIKMKSVTASKKALPSITAKKNVKNISFTNIKHNQGVKSAIKQRSEVKKKIVAAKDKNMILKESKQSKFQEKAAVSKQIARTNKIAPKESMKKGQILKDKKVVPLKKKKEGPVVRGTGVKQKNISMLKERQQPKKITVMNNNTEGAQVPAGESKSDCVENIADDEWIVEVLLDESEMDLMTENSRLIAGLDVVNVSKVSSSDDKDLDVGNRDVIDNNRLLECDSSTDMSKKGKTVGRRVKKTVGVTKRNSSAPAKVASETKTKVKEDNVTLQKVKEVTSSFASDKTVQINISVENKMAEMKKAIGDLERIADRSMLRLKAEERQVLYLSNKLRQYENDKHHRMLKKILIDSAPGPKQNPDAVFITDLLLSYCGEDDGDNDDAAAAADVTS